MEASAVGPETAIHGQSATALRIFDSGDASILKRLSAANGTRS